MVAAVAGIVFSLYDRASGPVRILVEAHNRLAVRVERLEVQLAAERDARDADYRRVNESLIRIELRQKEGYERLSRIEGKLDK